MRGACRLVAAACLAAACLGLDGALCFQPAGPAWSAHPPPLQRSSPSTGRAPQRGAPPGPAARAGRPLGRRAPLGSLRMTDFDAVRSDLRHVIQFVIGVGSLGTIATLVAAGVRGGQRDVALNAANFARWARTVSPEEWQKLAWCLFLDVVGAFPEFLLPGPTGEALDVLWAPFYAFLLFQTFGARPFLYKSVLAAAGFLEEVLPFTDFIPSATIGWFLESSTDTVRREAIGQAERALQEMDQKIGSKATDRAQKADRR